VLQPSCEESATAKVGAAMDGVRHEFWPSASCMDFTLEIQIIALEMPQVLCSCHMSLIGDSAPISMALLCTFSMA
jgi:hypothetical protein